MARPAGSDLKSEPAETRVGAILLQSRKDEMIIAMEFNVSGIIITVLFDMVTSLIRLYYIEVCKYYLYSLVEKLLQHYLILL